MSSSKLSITLTDEVLEMLDHAASRWPGLRGNRSALIAMAISRWYYASVEGDHASLAETEHAEEHRSILERLSAIESWLNEHEGEI